MISAGKFSGGTATSAFVELFLNTNSWEVCPVPPGSFTNVQGVYEI